MSYTDVRRKVFISYHHGDQAEAEQLVRRCEQLKLFIPRMLNASYAEDLINSNNPEYVMAQIRRRHLADTSVTLVLLGNCTHSRRYVDWEIKASLRQGSYIPNGLLGVVLPSARMPIYLPDRLEDNWNEAEIDCYARILFPPLDAETLVAALDDAYYARATRCHLIRNTPAMRRRNVRCRMCGVTH
jgi:hypothetical protein